MSLEQDRNYNLLTGFGGWKDWGKYVDEIRSFFRFKPAIRETGDRILREISFGKPAVSVHFRRTDYLKVASLNLGDDYYEQALSFFDREKYIFCVFSDDIDACKEMNIFDGRETYFMPMHTAGIDMYLMTQCEHNIIANSTYSLWGALLNPNPNKKVVCSHDFIGETDKANSHINGNYYPEDWIAL